MLKINSYSKTVRCELFKAIVKFYNAALGTQIYLYFLFYPWILPVKTEYTMLHKNKRSRSSRV